VLVELLDLQLGGLVEAFAVDALMRNVLDDVVARLHAALLDLIVKLFHNRVVAQFLLLGDDEQGRDLDLGRGVHSAISDVAGQIRTRVAVSLLPVGVVEIVPRLRKALIC
jgi:hypothetical protein